MTEIISFATIGLLFANLSGKPKNTKMAMSINMKKKTSHQKKTVHIVYRLILDNRQIRFPEFMKLQVQNQLKQAAVSDKGQFKAMN